jgi:TP901 family phage tail tape measure protein
MSDTELTVGLRAETGGASKEFNQVADSLALLSAAARQLGETAKALSSSVERAEKSIAGVGTAAKSAAEGQNLLARATAANATASKEATSFARAHAQSLEQEYALTSKGATAFARDTAARLANAAAASRQAAAAKTVAGAASRSSLGGGAATAPTIGPALGVSGASATAATRSYGAVNSALATFRQRAAAASTAASAYAAAQDRSAAAAANAARQAHLLNLQFSLQIVGSSLKRAGEALLSFGGAAVAVAASYQQSFAQVQRTTQTSGKGADELRDKLIKLSTEVPHTFEDIAGVAALGGQLGIASKGIVAFTEVVTKLKVTTDLTYDAAGTAIGRLSQLLDVPSGQFENLASSILKVGVNSVATESQIVKTANNLASIGNLAGFSAPQVLGLSGALASLGIPPELARGTFEQLLAKMGTAASSTTGIVEDFAATSGKSVKQFQKDFSTDASGALVDYLTGVGKAGPGARDALAAVGITSVRYVPTLLKLAQNMNVYKKALQDATSGYVENTALAKQYATATNTVDARVTTLTNTFKSFLYNIGKNSLGPVAGFLDLLQGLAQGLADIAANPVGGTILLVVAAIAALVGVLAVAGGTIALVVGGFLALQVALGGFSLSALSGSAASTVLTGVLLETAAADAALAAASAAAAAGLDAEAISAAGAAAANGVVAANAGRATIAMRALSVLKFAGVVGGILAVGYGLAKIISGADIAAAGLDKVAKANKENKQLSPSALAASYKRTTPVLRQHDNDVSGKNGGEAQLNAKVNDAVSPVISKIGLGGNGNALVGAANDQIKAIDKQLASFVASGNPDKAAAALKQMGVSAADAGDKFPVYTTKLSNYNHALITAAGTGTGVVTSNKGVAESFKEQMKAIDDLVKSINDFTSIQAASVNAQIGFEQAIDDTAAAATKAGKAAKDASGNFNLQEQSGRDAESAMLSLADAGNKYTAQLVNQGASQKVVDANVAKTTAAVRSLGSQYGLAGSALDTFVATYVSSPHELPYNVQVNGLSEAEAALLRIQRPRTVTITANIDAGVARSTLGGLTKFNGGPVSGFASGGFTGSGGKFQKAGIVHAGEFVFNQESTNRIGIPTLMALMNNKALPRQTIIQAPAAGAGNGSGFIALEPSQFQQLVAAVATMPPVIVGNERVARAGNAANLNNAQRGANG